jgi:hypothetical protein
MISMLAEKTNTPMARALLTTLVAYEDNLNPEREGATCASWITPTSAYSHGRHRFGLQFCPQCLREDEEPYFRRRWRLSFVTVCDEHNTPLLDRCPQCGAAVTVYKDLPRGSKQLVGKSLPHCGSCGVDLREAANRSELRPVQPSEIKFQGELLSALDQGWIEVLQDCPMYSHLFFSGLRLMLRPFTDRRAHELCKAFSQRSGVELLPPAANMSGRYFQLLKISDRRQLLRVAQYFLEVWPQRFVEFCRENRLWSRILLSRADPVPYWYWKVVTEHLYKGMRSPSNEEVHAAISYIKKRGDIPSQRAIALWLGKSHVFSRKDPEDFPGLVTMNRGRRTHKSFTPRPRRKPAS